MSNANEINLLKTIKALCSTKIRHPMTIEQIKAWLKQFEQGPEYTLALLILRFLIYRTSDQLDSSLKQALKGAATHFTPPELKKEDIDWRDVLSGEFHQIAFYYGPLRNEYTSPGKSGEVISRQLKHCIPIDSAKLIYPSSINRLEEDERFLLIDDATYTGSQLGVFIETSGQFMHKQSDKTGILVGIAHENAINFLSSKFPGIPIFYGEKITPQECFIETSKRWIVDKLWTYPTITPEDQYLKIAERANFQKKMPFGYGSLGCMIAYEHGIPDDSLQLLWDESKDWKPLFER